MYAQLETAHFSNFGFPLTESANSNCFVLCPWNHGGTLARRASFVTRALPVDCCC